MTHLLVLGPSVEILQHQGDLLFPIELYPVNRPPSH